MTREYIYIPTGTKVTAGDEDNLSPALFKPVEEVAKPKTARKAAVKKER